MRNRRACGMNVATRPHRVKRAFTALCVCVLAFSLTACGDPSAAYDRAVATFANGDYAEAADAFDKLGDYQQAATYAAYARGLVFYDQGNYAAAEPFFEQTQGFMYGKQRYAYCHACVLQDGDAFSEAAAAFLSLGDFEDSATRAIYCQARYAENTEDYDTALVNYEKIGDFGDSSVRLEDLQRLIYYHAKDLMTVGDYGQAIKFFSLLGDYLHSRELVKECSDHYRDQLYSQAEDYEKQGELQKAYDLFSGLSGYRDAQTRADDVGSKLGISQDNEE